MPRGCRDPLHLPFKHPYMIYIYIQICVCVSWFCFLLQWFSFWASLLDSLAVPFLFPFQGFMRGGFPSGIIDGTPDIPGSPSRTGTCPRFMRWVVYSVTTLSL